MAALGTIAKTGKQLQCTRTDEWLQKMWYIYIIQYYSKIKRDEIMPFPVTGKKPEMIILSETGKDRCHRIPFLVEPKNGHKMIFLHKRISFRDLKKKLMVTKEESFRGQRAISWFRLI